jgi:arylamine N-acetyltransferase
MNTTINIAEYFRRIGYTGKKTPEIETLREIQYHRRLQ